MLWETTVMIVGAKSEVGLVHTAYIIDLLLFVSGIYFMASE